MDAFSGATGAFIGSLCLYPFENLRTRLQASVREKQKEKEAANKEAVTKVNKDNKVAGIENKASNESFS